MIDIIYSRSPVLETVEVGKVVYFHNHIKDLVIKSLQKEKASNYASFFMNQGSVKS